GQCTAPRVPPAGDRAARRVLLARRFHARPGDDHPRLSRRRVVTAKVVVTDYTFPDLAAERKAADAAGAEFVAGQCRSEADVAELVRDADVVAVQFAPFGAAAAQAVKPGA